MFASEIQMNDTITAPRATVNRVGGGGPWRTPNGTIGGGVVVLHRSGGTTSVVVQNQHGSFEVDLADGEQVTLTHRF